jgi:hypothetical protein
MAAHVNHSFALIIFLLPCHGHDKGHYDDMSRDLALLYVKVT